MDRPDGLTTSPPQTNNQQTESEAKNIKLPSFSSLFASIQPQPINKAIAPPALGPRSGWTALTEAASAEYSQSAPSTSPWLSNQKPILTPPLSTQQHQPQQNIRLPPIHLVSPSGGYLHPLPSGLVGGPNGRDSRGPRSPPSSSRKRSNSLTGHPYAYAPSSRSTYEPPPVVTDLGRRPSLGNFGGAGPSQPSQVGPSGLSRRVRIQSRSPPRGYGDSNVRGRPSSPTQPRVVDYAAQARGRSGSQSDEHRQTQTWERDAVNHRPGGSGSYGNSVSPAPGSSYGEPYNRDGSYYNSRTNVASDLSALHISQGDSYRPISSHGPLPSMNTAPPYPHPPRSQPSAHMPPPPPPSRSQPADSNGARNGQGQGQSQSQNWTSQPPPSRSGYQAGAEANPHAVPVGASAPPEVGRYACPHCPKRFARPSSLRIHIHSHTGEKPFACQHCHRGFSVQSNLRRHLKIHRSNGTVMAEGESEGGGSMSDEDGSEEAMDVVG